MQIILSIFYKIVRLLFEPHIEPYINPNHWGQLA